MGTAAGLKFDPSGLPAPVATAASAIAQRLERGDAGEEVLDQLAALGRIRSPIQGRRFHTVRGGGRTRATTSD